MYCLILCIFLTFSSSESIAVTTLTTNKEGTEEHIAVLKDYTYQMKMMDDKNIAFTIDADGKTVEVKSVNHISSDLKGNLLLMNSLGYDSPFHTPQIMFYLMETKKLVSRKYDEFDDITNDNIVRLSKQQIDALGQDVATWYDQLNKINRGAKAFWFHAPVWLRTEKGLEAQKVLKEKTDKGEDTDIRTVCIKVVGHPFKGESMYGTYWIGAQNLHHWVTGFPRLIGRIVFISVISLELPRALDACDNKLGNSNIDNVKRSWNKWAHGDPNGAKQNKSKQSGVKSRRLQNKNKEKTGNRDDWENENNNSNENSNDNVVITGSKKRRRPDTTKLKDRPKRMNSYPIFGMTGPKTTATVPTVFTLLTSLSNLQGINDYGYLMLAFLWMTVRNWVENAQIVNQNHFEVSEQWHQNQESGKHKRCQMIIENAKFDDYSMFTYRKDLNVLTDEEKIDRCENNGQQTAYLWSTIGLAWEWPYVLYFMLVTCFLLRDVVQNFDGKGLPIFGDSKTELKNKMIKFICDKQCNGQEKTKYLTSIHKTANVKTIGGHEEEFWKLASMAAKLCAKSIYYNSSVVQDSYQLLPVKVKQFIFDLDKHMKLTVEMEEIQNGNLCDRDRALIDQENKLEDQGYEEWAENEGAELGALFENEIIANIDAAYDELREAGCI